MKPRLKRSTAEARLLDDSIAISRPRLSNHATMLASVLRSAVLTQNRFSGSHGAISLVHLAVQKTGPAAAFGSMPVPKRSAMPLHLKRDRFANHVKVASDVAEVAEKEIEKVRPRRASAGKRSKVQVIVPLAARTLLTPWLVQRPIADAKERHSVGGLEGDPQGRPDGMRRVEIDGHR